MTSLPLLLALLAPLHAGAVFVNGVRADDLRSQVFTDCKVRIDKEGNVWVDAPHYSVKVVRPEATEDAPAPPDGGFLVTVGKYWLVTTDEESTGHVVELYVNDVFARRIRSGDPQLILDVGPWLKPGENQIRATTLPGTPAGGILHVYVGQGANNKGTVKMLRPVVNLALRATEDPAGTTRTWTLQAE